MPPKRKLAMPPKKPGASKKYGVAPLMPEGEILTDFSKKQWRLEKSFATGGFGRIYFAQPLNSSVKGNFVIKMEPAENGPLFQEFHVYNRIMKPEFIDAYKNSKGLDFLGVPYYYGAGLHEKNGVKHRFLILTKLGSDLGKIRDANVDGKLTSSETDVFRLVQTCLDIYEYLHVNSYVHADLKAENLLLADWRASKTTPQIYKSYLMDYGLAKKLPETPIYKEQPKKAHDGTLIFTSLDAHRGCDPSYRGDVEILAYNVLLWLSGSLPWLSCSTSPERVFEAKLAFRNNLHAGLTSIFGVKCLYLKNLQEFFEYAYNLTYGERPNYNVLKRIVDGAVKNLTEKPIRKNSPERKTKAGNSRVVPKPPPARKTVAKSRERESDSEEDMFDAAVVASSKSSPRKKYVAKEEQETADSSTEDDDYKPTTSKYRRPTTTAVADNETADSSTEESDSDWEESRRSKPTGRPPIRKNPPAAVSKNRAQPKPFNRRLTMLEASLVKKYCRPAMKNRQNSNRKTYDVDYDDDVNGYHGMESARSTGVGTQTSPSMWENRRRKPF